MTRRSEVLRKWQLLMPFLTPRQRGLWAAAEAQASGLSGYILLTSITGLSHATLSARTRELESACGAVAGSLVIPASGRSRCGRKRAEVKDPGLEKAIDDLLADEIAGEPTSNQRWVRSSLRRLSARLSEVGHPATIHVVARLLRKKGYSLRVNKKKQAGADHPDRDKQFQYIAHLKAQYKDEGLPVISIDTKKKELVGNYRREGRSWKKEPIEVDSHFASYRQCVAVPFRIYDVAQNIGFVTIGISANTSEFAVNCLETWWRRHGKFAYPSGNRLLILADGGGANGYNLRTWKLDLQEKLCDAIGLTITVSHYPTGCSRWNPVEYRLFSQISMNWAGRPLRTLDAMLAFIRGTTTISGLTVEADLDQGTYRKGRKATTKQVAELALSAHGACPRWNYTLTPRLKLTP